MKSILSCLFFSVVTICLFSSASFAAIVCDIKAELMSEVSGVKSDLGLANSKVAIEQNASLTLNDGMGGNHSVSVSPKSLADGKVHTQISWDDSQGKNVVRTGLKIANGEQRVFGTVANGGKRYFLAITISCPIS